MESRFSNPSERPRDVKYLDKVHFVRDAKRRVCDIGTTDPFRTDKWRIIFGETNTVLNKSNTNFTLPRKMSAVDDDDDFGDFEDFAQATPFETQPSFTTTSAPFLASSVLDSTLSKEFTDSIQVINNSATFIIQGDILWTGE